MNKENRHKIEQIFKKEKNRLLAFIRGKVSRVEDAEDILQDVFYHTLRGYSVTEPIENLAGWLYTSARNRIIDYYRSKKRDRVSLNNPEISSTMQSLIIESHLNPETQFFRQLVADTISDAIESLPEKQQQIAVWQMIEGRTFQEISEMTGESINTLLSRKRYAVQTLRKVLQEINNLLNEH